MIIFWIGLIIAFLIIEIVTVGLTTIWFAGGAFIALLACALGLHTVWQIVLFFAVSSVLLCFTRPWALKYLTPHRTRTNYESAVGEIVKITALVDNLAATGTAVLNGQEWTARSTEDEVIIQAGTLAEVVSVAGVKLIVKPADSK